MTEKSPKVQAASLISMQRWLALATVDESGVPTASYVPFAPALGAFAIVVSRLSAHTPHLLAQRPAAVLMVGEDARDPYSRSRLSVDVTPHNNAAGSQEAQTIWSALEARHGETVSILRMLPDFEAISLAPKQGRLVLGFASAHDLDAATIQGMLR
ncbi:MAG: pyridoxamine 5'-phosphate oxidase family protein [Vulcanimicrobiaceae bacterium]